LIKKEIHSKIIVTIFPCRKVNIIQRSEIYSKTAIQAVKKGVAKSGSPTQDDQGEKVVKSRWWPRNGCDGRSMTKKIYLVTTIQVNFVVIFSEAGMRTQIDLNCCY